MDAKICDVHVGPQPHLSCYCRCCHDFQGVNLAPVPDRTGIPAVLAHPTARGPQVEGNPKPCGIPVVVCAVDLFPTLRRLLRPVPE